MGSQETYCQAAFPTYDNITSDRSAYLPWGTQFMRTVNAMGNPVLAEPVEWKGQVPNQAVFTPGNDSQLFTSPTVEGLTLANGFNTWFPNQAPDPSYVPTFNQAPAKSSQLWMIQPPPKFQNDFKAYCNRTPVTKDGVTTYPTSEPVQVPGFTAICSNGSQPVCDSNGGITCPDGPSTSWGKQDPLLVANKYVGAVRNNHYVRQEATINKGRWNEVAFDMVDCGGGVPCSCTDGDGLAREGYAPLTLANMQMVNGLFSNSVQVCANGTPARSNYAKQPISQPVPAFYGENLSTKDAVCPSGTMPACKKASATVVPDPDGTVLYPVCQFQSDDGESYPMVPICGDSSVPLWNATNKQFECDGSKQNCPDGTTPTKVVRAKCSDDTAPVCVANPTCGTSGLKPTVPPGYELRAFQNDQGVWQFTGYPVDGTGLSEVTPTCGYFGVKQTDVCPCDCIVDSVGAPVAEGFPQVDAQGNITCKDPNTEPNCRNMILSAQCVDSTTGVFVGNLPMCTDGSRAYYDTVSKTIKCADQSTPTCSQPNEVARATGIICDDDLNRGQQVRCVSTIEGRVCQPGRAMEPSADNQGGLSCPPGMQMSCPGASLPYTTSSVCQGVNTKPVCIPKPNVCGSIFSMPDFGAQAIAVPIDSRQTSNQSIAFCSSSSGASNSCLNILDHYFPSFSAPPGAVKQDMTGQGLLLPDPMTAGGLAQGVCLSQGKVVPTSPTDFTCAQATNPPTALTNWNQLGAGNMSAVPVGEPFALQQKDGQWPTEVYFRNQGLGDYDRGQIYYLNQTCAVDSSGACMGEHMGGVAMGQGALKCPRPDEEVHVVHMDQAGGGVGQFAVKCQTTGVSPHVVDESKQDKLDWAFPQMFTPDAARACATVGHVLASVDETEPLQYDEATGVWKGERTGRSAVCVPASRAGDVKAAVGASLPNRPCMNQQGIVDNVTYPGQGRIDQVFSYDPAKDTCVQNIVCADGICDSNLRANSIIDYHQGLTIHNQPIQFPAVYQSDTTFPVQMFGDLGTPGVDQKINASLLPIQPSTGDSAFKVPENFRYWARNKTSTKQKSTGTTRGVTLYNYDTPVGNFSSINTKVPVAESMQDTTGAGWDLSQQTVANEANGYLMENMFAPTVVGPMMSGVMAGGHASDVSPSNRDFVQYTGSTIDNMGIWGGGCVSKSCFDETQQKQPMALVYPVSFQKRSNPIYYDWRGDLVTVNNSPQFETLTTWQLGFGRCDPCGTFFYSSAHLKGGNTPPFGPLPPFTLGNIPGDKPTLYNGEECKDDNYDARMELGAANLDSCVAANALNSAGVDLGSTPGYQCLCKCDGEDLVMTKYSWQGQNDLTNTPDQWCNPDSCKEQFDDQNKCQSKEIFAIPVNSNQTDCIASFALFSTDADMCSTRTFE